MTTEPLLLISFGFLHLPTGIPPRADRLEDVRNRLRDPAAARDILDLDATHPRVREIVLRTPGADTLLRNLVRYAEECEPRIVAIGCAEGRHRAPALVMLLAKRLRQRDVAGLRPVVSAARARRLSATSFQSTLLCSTATASSTRCTRL